MTISPIWHPRLDADPAHRWLRQCVREACADQRGDRASQTDLPKRRKR
ncbi:Transcriptional regulator, LysR family protein [Enhygromyxa salina]|uniref:Transcriptional regulator, LysR family protein n=1 Tax=Enhygromyxa salina TaxID=215803 RepID=A0A0C1ZGB8_9BACT|nr:Transcriptional regulator, LysR family protein [Enhygromyxa salina]